MDKCRCHHLCKVRMTVVGHCETRKGIVIEKEINGATVWQRIGRQLKMKSATQLTQHQQEPISTDSDESDVAGRPLLARLTVDTKGGLSLHPTESTPMSVAENRALGRKSIGASGYQIPPGAGRCADQREPPSAAARCDRFNVDRQGGSACLSGRLLARTGST